MTPGIAYNGSFHCFTRHTLVWQGTKFAVLFLCPVTDISATVAPIGVKFCMMVYQSRTQSGGIISGEPQNFVPLKTEYLENGKLQHYMSIRA